MSTVVKSIQVNVPVSTAYEEWTRFEDLPRFLRGVTEVRRLDDRRLFWRALVAGVEREWELEIIEQSPERRIAWRSRSGPVTWGAVFFGPDSPTSASVVMEVHYDPGSPLETVSGYLGILSRWVRRNLERFKALVEEPEWRRSALPPVDQLVGQ